MMNKKLLIGVLLFFFTLMGFSQDLIVTRSNKKIFCSITKIDSLYLRYNLIVNKEFKHDSIQRSEVLNYYYRTAPTVKAKTDSINRLPREIVYLNFAYGFSFPALYFTTSDPGSVGCGMALPGKAINFSLAYKVSNSFGFMAQFLAMENEVDKEKLMKYYTEKSPSGSSVYVNSGAWSMKGTYFGVIYSLLNNKNSRFVIDADLLLGAPKYFKPNENIFITTNYTSYSAYTLQAEKRAFSFLVGAAMRYKLHKNASLQLGCDFDYANVNFDKVVTANTAITSYLGSYTQVVTTFNVKLGLTIMLYNKPVKKVVKR